MTGKPFHSPRRWVSVFIYTLGVIALFLDIASGFIWIRSYRVSDDLFWRSGNQNGLEFVLRGAILHSSSGGVKLTYDQYQNQYTKEAGSCFVYTKLTPDGYPTYFPIIGSKPPSNLGPFLFWSDSELVYNWTDMDGHWHARKGCEYDIAIILPWWFPMLISMPMSIIALRRWLRNRHQRLRMGLCAICGYDIRASPDRCPECGTSTFNLAK